MDLIKVGVQKKFKIRRAFGRELSGFEPWIKASRAINGNAVLTSEGFGIIIII